MGRLNEDFGVAAAGLNGWALALGKNVLEAAGIPVLAHSPGGTETWVGSAGHQQLQGGMLLVPPALLEKAKAALREACATEGTEPESSESGA